MSAAGIRKRTEGRIQRLTNAHHRSMILAEKRSIRGIMEKTVKKFATFQEADASDIDYLARLSGEERIQMLLELIALENPDETTIQRHARVYPLAESKRS